jgi:hypothetical protein
MIETNIPIKFIRFPTIPTELSVSFDKEYGQLYAKIIKLRPHQIPSEDIWQVIVFDRDDWILRSADVPESEALKILDRLVSAQSLQDLEEIVKGWEY